MVIQACQVCTLLKNNPEFVGNNCPACNLVLRDASQYEDELQEILDTIQLTIEDGSSVTLAADKCMANAANKLNKLPVQKIYMVVGEYIDESRQVGLYTHKKLAAKFDLNDEQIKHLFKILIGGLGSHLNTKCGTFEDIKKLLAALIRHKLMYPVSLNSVVNSNETRICDATLFDFVLQVRAAQNILNK